MTLKLLKTLRTIFIICSYIAPVCLVFFINFPDKYGWMCFAFFLPPAVAGYGAEQEGSKYALSLYQSAWAIEMSVAAGIVSFCGGNMRFVAALSKISLILWGLTLIWRLLEKNNIYEKWK